MMRLIMMGTGPFAVPTLEALEQSRHEVLTVVTRPERPHRGKRQPPASPVREAAQRLGRPVRSPDTVNSDELRAELAALRPDLLVVCDYGEILEPETLAVASHGGINLHASLLPRYRGAAPINWAILRGETETGNSVIHMTPQLDAGPLVAQCTTTIGPEETAPEIERRLAMLGAEMVCDVIDLFEAGEVVELPQDPAQATKAPRLKKTHGRIDWSQAAQQIKDRVRALQPWPQAFTFWPREGREPLRIILHRVAVQPGATDAPPGTVVEAGGRLLVTAGEDAIELLELQPSGKRPLGAADFLRGYPLKPGDRLE